MQTFVLHPNEGRERVLANLQGFLVSISPSKAWEVTIKQHKKKRSDEANRYLWGVVYRTLADATGHDADDFHEYFLGEMYGWEEYEIMGRKRVRPMKRSRKLSSAEFFEYVEFVRQRAAQQGIYIPDPGDVHQQ